MKALRFTARTLMLAATLARVAAAQTPSPGDSLTLTGAVAAALASDPRLAAASFNIEQATASQQATRSGRLPSLSLSASLTQFGEPMIVSPLHRLDAAHLPAFDETLVHAGLLASQTVYDGGATGARVARSRALTAAAQAGADEAYAGVLQDVIEAYLRVLSARDAIAADEQHLQELDAEVDRTRRLFLEGSSPRLAVLRAEAEASAVRADVEVARTRLRVATSSLARLMDVSSESVSSASLRDVTPPPELADASSPGQAEPASVSAARQQVSAAAAYVDESLALRRPRVSAIGALQEFGGARSDFATEWQGGIQIEYALFTGGARGHGIDQARAAQRVAQAQLEQLQRQVAEAAEVAQAARDEARARSGALQDAVLGFEELVRVERLALDEGAGVQRDYLNATASLAHARASLADVRRAQVLAEVRLTRAQGRLTLEWLTMLDQVAP